MLLEVKNLVVHYERIKALEDVSLELEEGGMIALVGANGAGKTTMLRTISGLKRPTSGEIWFAGKRIDEAAPKAIVADGIAHVPEGRRVFPYMTVYENLRMGAYTRKDKDRIAEDLERVYSYFPILKKRSKQKGGSLSGGEQQMLAIGRALMTRARLVLMDEPSLGLSPVMVQTISEVISNINQKEGVSILLVEQNTRMALKLTKHCYVLETGKVTLQGDSKDLSKDERVKKAYLGG
jgi:branched-chain amino acid transport system ATP-binding protein